MTWSFCINTLKKVSEGKQIHSLKLLTNLLNIDINISNDEMNLQNITLKKVCIARPTRIKCKM